MAKYFSAPTKLEYSWCEDFIGSVPMFIDNFVLYFHQVYHIEVGSGSIDSRYCRLNLGQIKATFGEIEMMVAQLTESLTVMKEEFEKASHVLLAVRGVLKTIKLKTQALLKDLQLISSITNFEEYQKAFNDCFKAISKDIEKNKKDIQVKKMIGLVKDSCMNQLYLETMLDLPCKIAHQLLKQRLQGSIPLEGLNKHVFTRYIGLMEKPEFVKSALIDEVDLKEFFDVIRVLLNQTQIVGQIKESKSNFGQYDKYVFKTDEFSSIYFSLKNNLIQIAEIEKNPQYLEEMKNFYLFDQQSNSIVELGKFTRKLWEYQHKIVMYHTFVQNFSAFRREVQEICISNFNAVVDISLKTV